MRQTLIIVATIMMLASCGGKEQSSTVRIAAPTVQEVNGIQRMNDYFYTDTVHHRGAKWEYTIVRLANDTADVVTDSDGQQYAGNTISLTINCDGQQILAKAFTKKTLADYVDAKFLSANILEGMAYHKAVPEGICFAVSVGLHLSEEYVQVRLTVHPDGSYSMRRDEIVDDNLAFDDSLGV